MAEEKINLRPHQRLLANGKSLIRHPRSADISGHSHIYVEPAEITNKSSNSATNTPSNRFGIEELHVPYSLNKKRRWQILDKVQQHDVAATYDDDENDPSTKVKQIGKRTDLNRKIHTWKDRQDDQTDLVYVVWVSDFNKNSVILRKNQKQKVPAGFQRKNHCRFDCSDPFEDFSDDDEDENEDQLDSSFESLDRLSLKLDHFIQQKPKMEFEISNATVQRKFDPKGAHVYLDQMNDQEKLFNEYSIPAEKSPTAQRLIYPINKPTSLVFNSILLKSSCLNHLDLSTAYGKDFLETRSYPLTYLFCLTDRLKQIEWSSKHILFSTNHQLNCYLIVIFNDGETFTNETTTAQVALNMNLNQKSIPFDFIAADKQHAYQIGDFIEESINLITKLPLSTFKLIEQNKIRRPLPQSFGGSKVNEVEDLNAQLEKVRQFIAAEKQTEQRLVPCQPLIRPRLCPACYQDVDERTPMTALRSCSHWICNDCWKQYLDASVKEPKLILCPEWNCSSIVDIGTFLSLTNISYLMIYQEQIERCLINFSTSFIRCPIEKCSQINQMNPFNARNEVRCRCGYIFCIKCHEETHFPATCSAFDAYIQKAKRCGDLGVDIHEKTLVFGRKCVSCNEFIEKNGGCNHMRCRCGAEFCWLCTGRWQDHTSPSGTLNCPKLVRPLETQKFTKHWHHAGTFYKSALMHRYERSHRPQRQLKEKVKRLVETIPVEKLTFNTKELLLSEIEKRETLLQNLHEMVKFIGHLHGVCEFTAVAADQDEATKTIDYSSFVNSFDRIIDQMTHCLAYGRGYLTVEILNKLRSKASEQLERLERLVAFQTKKLNSFARA